MPSVARARAPSERAEREAAEKVAQDLAALDAAARRRQELEELERQVGLG